MKHGYSLSKSVYGLIAGIVILFALGVIPAGGALQSFEVNPYDMQVVEKTSELASSSEDVRASAAEAIGFLRAYTAADELVEILDDYSRFANGISKRNHIEVDHNIDRPILFSCNLCTGA